MSLHTLQLTKKQYIWSINTRKQGAGEAGHCSGNHGSLTLINNAGLDHDWTIYHGVCVCLWRIAVTQNEIETVREQEKKRYIRLLCVSVCVCVWPKWELNKQPNRSCVSANRVSCFHTAADLISHSFHSLSRTRSQLWTLSRYFVFTYRTLQPLLISCISSLFPHYHFQALCANLCFPHIDFT